MENIYFEFDKIWKRYSASHSRVNGVDEFNEENYIKILEHVCEAYDETRGKLTSYIHYAVRASFRNARNKGRIALARGICENSDLYSDMGASAREIENKVTSREVWKIARKVLTKDALSLLSARYRQELTLVELAASLKSTNQAIHSRISTSIGKIRKELAL